MSKVTVSQLAEVLGISVDKLLGQLNEAGIEKSTISTFAWIGFAYAFNLSLLK